MNVARLTLCTLRAVVDTLGTSTVEERAIWARVLRGEFRTVGAVVATWTDSSRCDASSCNTVIKSVEKETKMYDT